MEKLIAGARKLGLELSSKQLEQFDIFYKELIEWNKRMNLTGITFYEDVQIKHFLDSLTVMLAIKQNAGKLRVIDVGTGAGIPGLPLKVLLPEIRLTLLEATAKKASFLKHVVTRMGFDEVVVAVGRAEDLSHENDYREKFDVALGRGVAPLVTLVELTLPFCRLGGCLITQKKGNIAAEINRAARAIKVLGGKLKKVQKIELEELNDNRCLVIIDKVLLTPPQYPRRPGVPAKRPLI